MKKKPKYGYFCFLAISRGIFQARAPKLMQTFIFWVYSAKKKVASSFRYGDYYSYWPSNKKNIAKSITILKLCERSFQWDLAACHISIRLEMAEEWRQVVKNLKNQ